MKNAKVVKLMIENRKGFFMPRYYAVMGNVQKGFNNEEQAMAVANAFAKKHNVKVVSV
jgi:hypothetical protein